VRRKEKMDKDISRPFENQIWAKAEIIAKRYNIRIEENVVLGYVANSQEMPCVWADGKTLANCLASSIRAHTVAVATMLEFGNEPPIPMKDRPLGEYNKIDIVLHDVDTTVNAGGLPQVKEFPPMPKCKPPKEEVLEEEMFALNDMLECPKEIKIESTLQIIEQINRDGDLREHEFEEENICCEGDDLGFYQQSCCFLLEKLAVVQTCKDGHKFVAKSHEYVCPYCVIENIKRNLS
jgi:predicted RNase H-like HicB family nuclease